MFKEKFTITCYKFDYHKLTNASLYFVYTDTVHYTGIKSFYVRSKFKKNFIKKKMVKVWIFPQNHEIIKHFVLGEGLIYKFFWKILQ